MNKLIPFSDFNSPSKMVLPTIAYNKANNCLRVGEHILFLETNEMYATGDEKLNEFFDFDFDLSTLMPKTPSEWVHMGVDGVSGVLDVISPLTGGATAWVSFGLDLIHSISYFIEAKVKPQEALGLNICGIITAAFATLPGVGNVAGLVLKPIMLAGKFLLGGIFKILFKIIKAPIWLMGKLINLLLGGIGIKALLAKQVAKFAETSIGKMFAKLPIFKQVMNFFRKDLDLVLEKTSKYLTKDLYVYSKSTIHSAEPAIKAAYKALDPTIRKTMSEKAFREINTEMLHRQMTGLGKSASLKTLSKAEHESMSTAIAAFYQKSSGTGRQAIAKATEKNLIEISKGYGVLIAKGELLLSKQLSGVALSSAKRQLGASLPKTIASTVAATAGAGVVTMGGVLKLVASKLTSIVSKIISSPLKFALKNAAKNGVTHNIDKIAAAVGYEGDDAKSSLDGATSGESDAKPSIVTSIGGGVDQAVTSIEGSNSPRESESLKDAFGLLMQEVETQSELGNISISFRVPNKDESDGKLVLTGDIYEGEKNLSDKLSTYTDTDALLTDIKLIRGKDDKERLRDGEKKKWERSIETSTPVVKSDGCSYSFYFIIRERSTISLAKKRIDETFDWEDILTAENLKKGFYKFSASLYIKITTMK